MDGGVLCSQFWGGFVLFFSLGFPESCILCWLLAAVVDFFCYFWPYND